MCCNRTGRRLQVLRTVFIPKRKKILFLKKQVLYRIFFYALGLLILALGLTLNTTAAVSYTHLFLPHAFKFCRNIFAVHRFF